MLRGGSCFLYISRFTKVQEERERKRGEGERGGTERRAQRPYRMTMEGNALSNLESQPCPGNTEGEKKTCRRKEFSCPGFLPWQREPSSPSPSLKTQCKPAKAVRLKHFFFFFPLNREKFQFFLKKKKKSNHQTLPGNGNVTLFPLPRLQPSKFL